MPQPARPPELAHSLANLPGQSLERGVYQILRQQRKLAGAGFTGPGCGLELLSDYIRLVGPAPTAIPPEYPAR